MGKRSIVKSRYVIVVGFVTMSIGFVIQLVRLSLNNPPSNFQSTELIFYYATVPAAALISAWSWWWLSHVCSSDETSEKFRRWGVRGIAVQSLLSALGSVAIGNLLRSTSATADVVGWFVAAAGGLILAFGFWKLGEVRASDWKTT